MWVVVGAVGGVYGGRFIGFGGVSCFLFFWGGVRGLHFFVKGINILSLGGGVGFGFFMPFCSGL